MTFQCQFTSRLRYKIENIPILQEFKIYTKKILHSGTASLIVISLILYFYETFMNKLTRSGFYNSLVPSSGPTYGVVWIFGEHLCEYYDNFANLKS